MIVPHLRRPRRAFTIIELLVAVAIIAILLGLAIPAVGYAVRKSRIATTRMLMNQVKVAVEEYLTIYPKLGDAADSADFAATPWTFLAVRPVAEGRKAFLEMDVRRLAKGTDPDYQAATARDATLIGDGFPTATGVTDPLLWKLINATATGASKPYTKVILLRSRAGTPATPDDDLILRYSTDTGRWDQKTWAEVASEWGP